MVLEEACAVAGLDPAGARLVRLGSHAVYNCADLRVIVRIAADPDALAEMQRAVRVARWLAAEGFPANRVVADVAQPLVVGGRVVTFWESVQDDEEYASVTELADLLKRLYWLEEPESLELPYFDPFAKVRSSLRGLGAGVQPEDVKHYGFDLMNWPGYPVLADVRELMMTLWMGGKAAAESRAAEEFVRRVEAIRTNGSRRDWAVF
ncbi:hypothetical protein AB0399_19590 [Streptomyces sp. NPDC088194]|uniref:hypothetical protein n=1 Tax=Streptomyces sp. NPDC088194 TaxID=3154931 RepID=UPI003450EE2A